MSFFNNESNQIIVPDSEKLKEIDIHENTFVSKEALKIERKILIDLNTVLKFFRVRYLDKINEFTYQRYFEEFKRITQTEVYNIFRTGVQQAYELGTAYVTDSLNTTAYLTDSDIKEIETITDNYSVRFYGRIENALKAGEKKFYDNFEDVTDGIINVNIPNREMANQVIVDRIEKSASYMFSSLAILVVTESLNKATIIKAQKLLPESNDNIFSAAISSNPRGGTYGTGNDHLFERLLGYEFIAGEDQDISSQNDPTGQSQLNPRLFQSRTTLLQWKTRQDEFTCPICKPLSDKFYLINDPTIPIPGLGTHFNCRCRLLLVRF